VSTALTYVEMSRRICSGPCEAEHSQRLYFDIGSCALNARFFRAVCRVDASRAQIVLWIPVPGRPTNRVLSPAG